MCRIGQVENLCLSQHGDSLSVVEGLVVPLLQDLYLIPLVGLDVVAHHTEEGQLVVVLSHDGDVDNSVLTECGNDLGDVNTDGIRIVQGRIVLQHHVSESCVLIENSVEVTRQLLTRTLCQGVGASTVTELSTIVGGEHDSLCTCSQLLEVNLQHGGQLLEAYADGIVSVNRSRSPQRSRYHIGVRTHGINRLQLIVRSDEGCQQGLGLAISIRGSRDTIDIIAAAALCHGILLVRTSAASTTVGLEDTDFLSGTFLQFVSLILQVVQLVDLDLITI